MNFLLKTLTIPAFLAAALSAHGYTTELNVVLTDGNTRRIAVSDGMCIGCRDNVLNIMSGAESAAFAIDDVQRMEYLPAHTSANDPAEDLTRRIEFHENGFRVAGMPETILCTVVRADGLVMADASGGRFVCTAGWTPGAYLICISGRETFKIILR